MPSPVGHVLGGLLVGFVLTPSLRTRDADSGQPIRPAKLLAACAIAACLPDIDFLWGRHSMETHSLGFAVGVGLVALALWRSTRIAVACALAVGTHILFDWLGSDDFPPLGVMALWPLNSTFYFADAYVFATISRRYWRAGFVRHNLLAILRELVILLPIVAVAWWMRRRQSLARLRLRLASMFRAPPR